MTAVKLIILCALLQIINSDALFLSSTVTQKPNTSDYEEIAHATPLKVPSEDKKVSSNKDDFKNILMTNIYLAHLINKPDAEEGKIEESIEVTKNSEKNAKIVNVDYEKKPDSSKEDIMDIIIFPDSDIVIPPKTRTTNKTLEKNNTHSANITNEVKIGAHIDTNDIDLTKKNVSDPDLLSRFGLSDKEYLLVPIGKIPQNAMQSSPIQPVYGSQLPNNGYVPQNPNFPYNGNVYLENTQRNGPVKFPNNNQQNSNVNFNNGNPYLGNQNNPNNNVLNNQMNVNNNLNNNIGSYPAQQINQNTNLNSNAVVNPIQQQSLNNNFGLAYPQTPGSNVYGNIPNNNGQNNGNTPSAYGQTNVNNNLNNNPLNNYPQPQLNYNTNLNNNMNNFVNSAQQQPSQSNLNLQSNLHNNLNNVQQYPNQGYQPAGNAPTDHQFFVPNPNNQNTIASYQSIVPQNSYPNVPPSGYQHVPQPIYQNVQQPGYSNVQPGYQNVPPLSHQNVAQPSYQNVPGYQAVSPSDYQNVPSGYQTVASSGDQLFLLAPAQGSYLLLSAPGNSNIQSYLVVPRRNVN